jgi:hypothetical protein
VVIRSSTDNSGLCQASYRFGSKQSDVAALDYSPTHTDTMATWMCVFAGKHDNDGVWVQAVGVSTHCCYSVLRITGLNTDLITAGGDCLEPS